MLAHIFLRELASAQSPLFQLRSHLLQIAPEEERAEAWEGIDGIRAAQIRAGKLDAELYIGIGRTRYELAEQLYLATDGLYLAANVRTAASWVCLRRRGTLTDVPAIGEDDGASGSIRSFRSLLLSA